MSMLPTSFIVEDDQSPLRIDKYLAERLSEVSRSQIQKLIDNKDVTLNGIPVEQSRIKVMPGDNIIIQLLPDDSSEIKAQDMPLEILYEDEHLACVNKTAGIPVHPAGSRLTGTLVNALLHHIKTLSNGSHQLRPGIVHRLDQGTSGVILIAKNDSTHEQLSSMFKERRIKKIYYAVVHGEPPADEGEIHQPIRRNPSERKEMMVHRNGKPSHTYYRSLKRGLGGSLLEVYPYTGRTHQIRVHFKHTGFPVVGDPLYCKAKLLHRGQMEKIFEDYPGFGLHAKSLTFEHPFTKEMMTIEAPLPKPFQLMMELML